MDLIQFQALLEVQKETQFDDNHNLPTSSISSPICLLLKISQKKIRAPSLFLSRFFLKT